MKAIIFAFGGMGLRMESLRGLDATFLLIGIENQKTENRSETEKQRNRLTEPWAVILGA